MTGDHHRLYGQLKRLIIFMFYKHDGAVKYSKKEVIHHEILSSMWTISNVCGYPIGGKIMSVNSVVHTDCYGHEVHNQKIEVSDVPGSYEFTMKQYYGIDNHTKLFGN